MSRRNVRGAAVDEPHGPANADLEQGRRDGKHGIPHLAQVQYNIDNGYPWLPTHMKGIIADAHHENAKLREEFAAQFASIQAEVAGLETQRVMACDALNDAKLALEKAAVHRTVAPTADDLKPRSTAEEAMSEAQIRGIRYQEAEARYASLMGLVQTCRTNVGVYEAAIAVKRAWLNSGRPTAQSQVDGIYARCRKRLQDYWQGLTEKHRDGDALSVLLTDDQLPEAPEVKEWLENG